MKCKYYERDIDGFCKYQVVRRHVNNCSNLCELSPDNLERMMREPSEIDTRKC